MPLTKFKYVPGINTDDTDLTNEVRFRAGNLVRFRFDKAETIGGWERVSSTQFDGIARGAHTWAPSGLTPFIAWGTATKLYTYSGGVITDVTGAREEGTLTDPFQTANGTPTVTVSHTGHGVAVGETVTFSNAAAVGGITVNGAYTVTSVTNPNVYKITHGSNASSTASGGGAVDYVYALPAGNVDGNGSFGYGTGAYGSGPYGVASLNSSLPRVWSLRNYGDNLLAVPTGGGLYEYQPDLTYAEILAGSPALGTGWSGTSAPYTASAGSASNLSWAVDPVMTPGKVYRATFSITWTAGTFQARLDALDIGSAITKSGTYSRLFTAPVSAANFLINKDASGAGTVTAVSVKLEENAYRITSAPASSVGMFVAPNRQVVCYGATEEDGDDNLMNVRWSDIENNRQWTTDPSNLAGEYPLAEGGRCVGGLAGNGRNYVFTDTAAYGMTFTGDSAGVYRFDLLGTGCGLIGKNAVAEHGGMVFWASNNRNFYVYRGGQPEIIPCTVKTDFFDNLSYGQNEKIHCVVLAQYNEVWWFRADTRDGAECSRAVGYNWAEGQWHTHIITRSCGVDQGVFERPIWFGTDGYLYYHETGGTANGDVMSASLETGYFDVGDGDTLAKAVAYQPDFENQAGAVNFTISGRGSARASDITLAAQTVLPSTEWVRFRLLARQIRMVWESTGTPCTWRMGDIIVDVEPRGAKR